MKIASYFYNFKYGVTARKPKLLARYLRNYWSVLVNKQIPLRYIDACTTLSCNLNCMHCFAKDFAHTDAAMSVEQWKDIFQQCKRLGNLAIGFTGGEPCTDKRLEELIRNASPEDTLILATTNGTLLTPELCHDLYKAGLDVFQVSVDSFDPKEHNEFRQNKNAYQRTMQGIQYALDAGIKVTIAPTISKQNLRSSNIHALFDWARSKGLMVNMALATPTGNWNANRDILLTPEDYQFIDTHITKKYPNVRRDFETNYMQRGCGAANEKLYFTVDGEVLVCPYMHITFGNIKNESVADIRERALSIDVLKGYHPKCLMAEDRDFIDGPLSKTWDKDIKPVPWDEVFVCQASPQRTR